MMDPASKRCRGSNKDVNQEEDRISNLPSCLIGHILSLLPTKEAVATSVLSKQWKNHWTLVSRLEFDDYKVGMLRLLRSRSGAPPKRCFTNFVCRVLRCRSLRITNFRIKCNYSYNVSVVSAWFSTVLRWTNNIRQLDIFVKVTTPDLRLPRNLFISDTLVELKLGRYFVIDLPASVNLPSLKVLSLDYVEFLEEDSITRLLVGCPVLEELSLLNCIGKEVKHVNISAPGLTSLNLNCLGFYRIKFVLRTPNLSYLILVGRVTNCYELKDLNNLSQAKIEFYHAEDADEAQRESLHRLLEGISKVKSLELGDNLMQAILSCKFQLPEFHNNMELKLGCHDIHVTAKLLPMLLKKITCVTTLTFYKGLGFDYAKRPITFSPLEDVPDCLVLGLKKIEIRNFQWSNNEQTMLEYFLKNAKKLEKLVICDLYDISRASSIISKIPMASRICKVELSTSRN